MGTTKRALLLIDIQNDFLPGGALAVGRGDEVIPVANRLQAASGLWDVVAMTQDWHPPSHQSFAVHHAGRSPGEVIELHGLQQVLWPVHCVQGSEGAEFAAALDTARVMHVSRKGTDPEVDSYSGFFDNGRRHATDLEAFLRDRGVGEVYVCGLATDYCVKWTALDAAALGFTTHVVVDGCRGVGLSPDDVPKALEEMRAAGVTLVESAELTAA
jgi:nicotinamidase/pyrazinamidase